MLDTTFVMTLSEFGRAPGDPAGYGPHNGTDHGSGDSWRNQAHVFFGAGITPKLLAPTNDDTQPTEGVHSTHALLATLCQMLGVPQAEIDALWPPGSSLYPEKALLDLWA